MFRVRIPLVLSSLIIVFSLFSASPGLAADKTIGVILTGDIPYYRDVHNAFTFKLNSKGYASKVEIIVQRPYPDPISLSNAARKLIALDVDVIVTCGTPATLAALGEKTNIPIVYVGVYEPFVPKIKARNVTGVLSRVSISSLLRYLRGITSISTLGAIYSTNEGDSVYQMKELVKLSEQYGVKIEGINLKRHQEAKEMLSGKRIDALFITGSAIGSLASSAIMEYSRESKIPSASMMPDKNANATIALYSDPKDLGEKAADMVMKILGGVPPERIGADSSSQVELVFNLRGAKDMGFKIPMDLITESTRLIK